MRQQHVRQQHQHQLLWASIVHAVRAAGERERHLQRDRVRLRLQRGLPPVRRDVRQQHQHQFLRRHFLQCLRAAGQRHRHVQRDHLRFRLQRRLPPVR